MLTFRKLLVYMWFFLLFLPKAKKTQTNVFLSLYKVVFLLFTLYIAFLAKATTLNELKKAKRLLEQRHLLAVRKIS